MRRFAPLLVWMLAVLPMGCSPTPEAPETRYAMSVRARALLEIGDLKQARKLQKRVADASHNAEDWTNLGLIELRLGKIGRAEACWKQATELDSRCARAAYQLGALRHVQARSAEQRANEGSSSADALRSEAKKLLEGAAEALTVATAAAPDNATAHQLLATVDDELGRSAAAQKARAEGKRLDPLGLGAAAETEALSSLRLPPRPDTQTVAQPRLRFEATPAARGATGVACIAVSGARPGLVLYGTGSQLRADSIPGAPRLAWSLVPLLQSGAIDLVASAPLDADAHSDLVLCVPDLAAGTELLLVRGGGAGQAEPLARVPYAVRALQCIDLDADGDLDLVMAVSVPPGLRVWRNEGNARFEAEVPVAGLASLPPMIALVAADLDGDARTDLVCADDFGRLRVLVQRAGSDFADVAAVSNLGAERARSLAVADLDADGRNDLLLGNDAGLWVYNNRGAARFVRQAAYRVPETTWTEDRPPGVPVAALLVTDLDNDGMTDIVTLQMHASPPEPVAPLVASATKPPAGAPKAPGKHEDTSPGAPPVPLQALAPAKLRFWRNDGRGVLLDATDSMRLESEWLMPAMPAAADFDQDGDLDLAVVRADSLVEVLWNDGGNSNRRLEIQLGGDGSPAAACIGTRLELHAGGYAHSLEARQLPLSVGIGTQTRFDVVRVVWPDGRVQNQLDVPVPATAPLHLTRGAASR